MGFPYLKTDTTPRVSVGGGINNDCPDISTDKLVEEEIYNNNSYKPD